MGNDAYRNRLLTFLLLNDRVLMQEMISEMGSRLSVEEAIEDLLKIFAGDIGITIDGDLEEITMNVINSKSLYEKLETDKFHDFNDRRCRIAYLLHQLIKRDVFIIIDDLAEEMNVSRSSVNNDIRAAKDILLKYNAKIKGVPNKGIHYVGDEFSKRLVTIYEIFEYFPLASTLNETMVEEIRKVSTYYGLSELMKILLFKATMTSVHRIKKGYAMDQAIPMYKNFEKDSNMLSGFIRKMEEIHGISISGKEIDFISFPINTRNSAYVDDTDNEKNEELLERIVAQMIEKVRSRFMIHVDENEFFEKVKLHLLFLINRLIFRIPVKDIFTEQIKIRFPLAFELAKISMAVLHEEYKLIGTRVDVSYLAVYFALILDERKIVIENITEKKKVAIVTNNGRATFELIKRQLQEIIGPDSCIELLTLMDLKQKDVSNYSILFSTENILTDLHLPVIQIEGIIDEAQIAQRINEIRGQGLGPMDEIRKLIEVNVKILEEKESYKGHVKSMIADLVHRGIASEDVYDLFVKKENVSSMVYENGVAFPHLTDATTDQFSLTLGIVKEETQKIKLIFFLLIPENLSSMEENALLKIYDEIFTIISDSKMVKRLRDLDSAADLNLL